MASKGCNFSYIIYIRDIPQFDGVVIRCRSKDGAIRAECNGVNVVCMASKGFNKFLGYIIYIRDMPQLDVVPRYRSKVSAIRAEGSGVNYACMASKGFNFGYIFGTTKSCSAFSNIWCKLTC